MFSLRLRYTRDRDSVTHELGLHIAVLSTSVAVGFLTGEPRLGDMAAVAELLALPRDGVVS